MWLETMPNCWSLPTRVLAKRTPPQCRPQGQGGMGIKTLRQTEKNGKIIGVKVVHPEHESDC